MDGGVSDTSERKYSLWKMIIDNLGDLISNKFNFYVDTEKNLIDLMISDVTHHKLMTAKELFDKSMMVNLGRQFGCDLLLKSRESLGLAGEDFFVIHLMGYQRFAALLILQSSELYTK